MPEHPASVALEVLSSLSSSIPPRELASARGLLITRTHRAALGFGVQTGTAVALRRVDGGDVGPRPETSTPSASSFPSNWSAPLVFAVRRASFGVSYGYATVDSVLLLKTDEEARLLAAGAPAFGVEHRFVSSVLDGDDGDDSVEVEVEGSGLDEEGAIRSEAEAAAAAASAASGEAAAAAASAASGEAAAAAAAASAASGEAAAAAAAASAAPPAPAASSAAATLPPARSALLFSRSSGALVDMSVVAGMLSLDSAAHAALYCPEASAPSNAASPSAPAARGSPPPPPPPGPEDVLAGTVERPAAFASVYQLLEEMEQRGQQQQQQQQRGRGRE